MKKLTLIAVFISCVAVCSAQSRWNIGLQTGCVTNISRYESGDEVANALFKNNTHHSILFGVDFRYKISNKFSLQSGMHFTEFGFNYSMAKDYSLLECQMQEDDIVAATCITSIPTMIIMNTPQNCSHTRFIFGAGFAVRGIDQKWDDINTNEVTSDEGGNTPSTTMTATAKSTSGISPAFVWMIGLEKMLRAGNSLSFTFQGNQGMSTIAESTVHYTASNKEYTHTFINRGSYVSFAFAYNFAPFGTRKANKLKNTIKPL